MTTRHPLQGVWDASNRKLDDGRPHVPATRLDHLGLSRAGEKQNKNELTHCGSQPARARLRAERPPYRGKPGQAVTLSSWPTSRSPCSAAYDWQAARDLNGVAA